MMAVCSSVGETGPCAPALSKVLIPELSAAGGVDVWRVRLSSRWQQTLSRKSSAIGWALLAPTCPRGHWVLNSVTQQRFVCTFSEFVWVCWSLLLVILVWQPPVCLFRFTPAVAVVYSGDGVFRRSSSAVWLSCAPRSSSCLTPVWDIHCVALPFLHASWSCDAKFHS